MKIHGLWLSVSALTLVWCGVAGAQTTSPPPRDASNPTSLQEVVVTAERRSTNLQTTPIAATVLTGVDLQKKGVFTVDQLQFVSPSITVNNFGQGDNFDIRGIGKGETNSQTSTGVVTYRDGVATFPGYFTEEPYFDVSDVEILRGPQGTFSGQNATGGAVIVNTQNPVIGGGYNGYLLAHYGNYNDAGLQGVVNLPISDTFAARFAFNGQYRDSFYNLSDLKGDPNLKWGSARLSLLWTPTASLKVLFKTDYDYLDNGGYFGDLATDPGTGSLFHFNYNNQKTYATDQFVRSILKIDYTDSGGVDFRSVTGYQQGRSGWQGGLNGSSAPGLNISVDEAANEEIWSQEFNIISPDHGPVTWVLGAYYQYNRYDFPAFDIGIPTGTLDDELRGSNPTNTEAVFGQVSFNLPDGFQLQAGLRYSAWSNSAKIDFFVPELALLGVNYPQNQTVNGQNITGKITLNWNLNSANFLYAFVATGAKPGGLNTALVFDGGTIPPPFEQEYVTDYEVGWKSRWFDGHLRTQIGAYYNDFQHFQVSIPIPNNPTQTTELNNPNATTLYGFEASAQAVFGDFSFNGGLGLEHSALGQFYAEDPATANTTCNPTTGPATAVCIDLKGHPQTYAPDVTFNIGAQYNFKFSAGEIVTPSVTFSHISDQWATVFDNVAAGEHLGPRDILGASVAWTHGDVVTTLYGYNLTNDQYVSSLLNTIRLAGAPRQFGISIKKSF